MEALEPEDRALLDLLRWLDAQGYGFVTPTPATHARVVRRRRGRAQAGDLRDILGWSLPFAPREAPARLVELLAAAGALSGDGEVARSRVRVSRLKGRLFIHSAYPTRQKQAVFFGPDSYRFVDFISAEIASDFAGRVVDLGGGCGPGAVTVADRWPGARVLVSDVNRRALRNAQVSARHARLQVAVCAADGLRDLPHALDLVIANPPYMAASRQTYRDGGDLHGGRRSLQWAGQALEHLRPGGRMLLYTGSAIGLGGADPLRDAMQALCAARGATLDYREIDPDVFGEELRREAYADVERIAAVGCVITAAGPRPARG